MVKFNAGKVIIMDEFIVRALLGGVGVAIISGPIGCLVVWQRMSYFGAALSHAALLGIAMGFFLQINLTLAIFISSAVIATLLLLLSRNKAYSTDTLLGVLAHASLALGIILLSMLPEVRVDLMAYLFGDILSVGWQDIIWIYLGGLLSLAILAWIWNPILSLTLHRDLAISSGENESLIRFIFLFILSFIVAISMQVVGALLIISLLIIPAATARKFANSPEQMALIACGVGVMSVLIGLWCSLRFDTPAGPSIVLAASFLFALSLSRPSRH